MISYNVLSGLPPYGERATSFPKADGFREGAVIEFKNSDGLVWVGNFASNRQAGPVECVVCPELGDDRVMVVADGSGYIIDATQKALVSEVPGSIGHIAYCTSVEAVIVCTKTDVSAYTRSGCKWTSERISWDEIVDVVIDGTNLSGRAYDLSTEDWYDFSVDLNSGVVEGGLSSRYPAQPTETTQDSSDVTNNANEPHAKENIGLKLALELGPLLVFFFANSYGDKLSTWFPVLSGLGGPLFVATALFMAATVISLVLSKLIVGKLPLMPLISGFVVLSFGALSIWLQDETFIKMKPTIINTLFGVILLGGLFFGRSLLGYVFNSAFELDDEGWNKLALRWGLFFLFLAVLNEVVWRGLNWYYLPDAKAADNLWVTFKVWGTMPITFLFTLSQMPLIMKHSIETKE